MAGRGRHPGRAGGVAVPSLAGAALEKDPDEDVLDRFNIAAGQKSEHYQIAMYENLVTLAESEGLEEAAELLRN